MVSVEEKVRCGDGLLTVEGSEVLVKRVTVSAIAELSGECLDDREIQLAVLN